MYFCIFYFMFLSRNISHVTLNKIEARFCHCFNVPLLMSLCQNKVINNKNKWLKVANGSCHGLGPTRKARLLAKGETAMPLSLSHIQINLILPGNPVREFLENADCSVINAQEGLWGYFRFFSQATSRSFSFPFIKGANKYLNLKRLSLSIEG